MTETVAVALITATTGLLGAVLGSAAALFGPALVGWATRRAEAKEMRRVRIVEYVKSGVALVNAEALVEMGAGSQSDVYKAMDKLNADTLDLTSHMRRRHRKVLAWIREAEAEMDAQTGAELRRDYWSAISSSLQNWHAGSPAWRALRPFVIERDGHKVQMDQRKTWH
jgi:hypothetical protein